MKHLKLSLILLCLYSCITLKANNKDSIAVAKATKTFVTAFNTLDWPTFKAYFMQDATIFYPTWYQSNRVTEQIDIEVAWTNIFPEFEDPNNQRILKIDPKDLHIQLYGQTAIVTFHLGKEVNNLSRRTLVMIKEKKRWKIAHLHASAACNDKSD